MRVVVDPKLCQAHAQCILVAPEVFELGDDDVAHVKRERLPTEIQPRVIIAVRACPVRAISLIDE
ncbi:MAG: ferredoxin [Acidimicrobiales bacterium]